MSPDETLLMTYQKEKEELLRDPAKSGPAHLLKNRLKILDGKINFLQQQIKLTRPHAAPRPAPALKLKPFAAMEPRRRIYVAAVRQRADLRPMAGLQARDAAQQAVVPVSVAFRPQALPIPQKMILREPAPPRLLQSPVGEAAGNGMKGVKTGADWKTMPRADKEIYILSVMGNLSRHDVFLERPYGFYINDLDGRFQSDPRLEKEYVHRVLLKSAYENEPESRKDILKVWK